MLNIFLCARDQHNGWFVLLAAVICLIATMSAVMLLRHARHYAGAAAASWIGGAAIAIGFGIWATHFVAMLGYNPGVIVGYHLPATALSLLIAIVMTALSFYTAISRPSRIGLAFASLLSGGGVAVMHYCGMSALELPAHIRWRGDYVAASLAFAVLLTYPALALAIHGRSRLSGIVAALLMALSVVLLHFTGMAAVTLIPARLDLGTSVILSPTTMAGAIGVGSIGLLVLSIVMMVVSRSARIALDASERERSILVKSITDCAICMLDRSGHVANWNLGAERLLGYGGDEAIGLPLAHFYTPDERALGLPQQALLTATSQGKFVGEGWRVRRDGSQFWAHVTIESILGDNAERAGFAQVTRDMSRLKEEQDSLVEIASHLDAALGNMHQGLCLFDAGERLRVVNTRFREIWKLQEEDCQLGMSFDQFIHALLAAGGETNVQPERINGVRRLISATLADPQSKPMIADLEDNLVVSLISRPLPDGGWVTTCEDITERQRSESRIAHMAMYDSLTGLPNRSNFNRWVDVELEQARDIGQRLGVVMIDLDRFKEINDTRGHGAGDLALQHLAKRLADVLGDGEIAARMGGDEFAAAKVFTDDAEIIAFVTRLEECFATPFGPENNNFLLSASLGVSLFPQDGNVREQILNNADLAMYRAKTSVADHTAYYKPEMDETARARRQLANDLRHAIDHDELTVLYQPQHELGSGELSGYEALLRWQHPQKGAISPTEFIPIAEETGEIFRIGEWVLREACREARRWPNRLKIAVNLSPVQLLQSDLMELVTGILVETGLSPTRLELEITETAIIADKARALHFLRQIKALGVSIAMDDFGTGYSSLDTLHSFPFDKIKIDKSFLLNSAQNPESRAIIKAVLALGQSLKVPVLAEGVETVLQLEMLKEEGCDQVQGYYFGYPAAAPSTLAKQPDILKTGRAARR